MSSFFVSISLLAFRDRTTCLCRPERLVWSLGTACCVLHVAPPTAAGVLSYSCEQPNREKNNSAFFHGGGLGLGMCMFPVCLAFLKSVAPAPMPCGVVSASLTRHAVRSPRPLCSLVFLQVMGAYESLLLEQLVCVSFDVSPSLFLLSAPSLMLLFSFLPLWTVVLPPC